MHTNIYYASVFGFGANISACCLEIFTHEYVKIRLFSILKLSSMNGFIVFTCLSVLLFIEHWSSFQLEVVTNSAAGNRSICILWGKKLDAFLMIYT